MKTRKDDRQAFTDKKLLKILTLNYGESNLFNSMMNHPGRNRLGCLEGRLIWDLNLQPLPLFQKTFSEVKKLHVEFTQKCLNGLAKQQLIFFDKETDLIYLTIYLRQFPLKNINEGRKAERLFNEIPQQAIFYPLLALDLSLMIYLKESFRRQLTDYLNDFLQSGETTSC